MTRLSIIAIFLCLPTIAPAQWTTELFRRNGSDPNSRYGGEIFPLKDQNNDGFDDWAVMAWGQTSPYAQDARVELFHGGNPPSSTPYWLLVADSIWPRRIEYAGAAGDLNGDGLEDWFVLIEHGESPYDCDAEIYFGGLNPSASPDLSIPVPHPGWIYSMRDVNSDGYDDLFVDKNYFQNTYGDNSGAAYFGGSPMDTVPDWIIHSPVELPRRAALQSFGDLNGDGYSDAWSFSWSPAMGYIYFGSAQPDTVPAVTWMNYNAYPSAILRDINGDGRDDLLVQGDNAIEVHYGRTVMSRVADAYINCPVNTWRFVSAGDLNADGYNDFISYASDGDLIRVAAIYLGYRWTNPNPVFQFVSGGLFEVATVGDVNGDGADDWAVGVSNLSNAGTVIIYSGNRLAHVAADEPHTPGPQAFAVNVFPNPFNSVTTILCNMPNPGPVALSAFDVLGRRVALLNSGFLERGTHQLRFDAGGLPSGTYVLRLQSGECTLSRELRLVR